MIRGNVGRGIIVTFGHKRMSRWAVYLTMFNYNSAEADQFAAIYPDADVTL